MATPKQEISKQRLVEQLLTLAVESSGVLIVHTSFSKVAPVEGGPTGLIEALRTALGPEGTLVMPSMGDDDDHPFDPKTSSCRGMGVVADTFWRLPGVLRSNSPHAFAAIGPKAARITADHPLTIPHGPDSPPGRVIDLDGQVLLLGVGHDSNTTIHVSENMAGVRYRLPVYSTVLENGELRRINYDETDHCCENFALMDGWLEAEGLQERGTVGHAEARLVRSRDIIRLSLEHLRANETTYLHPIGVDEECDAARASMPVTSS